jgi:tetratricopeptide (TPR) repeat protein
MQELDRIHTLIAAAISQNRNADARDLIEQALGFMPANWKPLNEDEQTIRGAFWDMDEFLAYVDGHASDQEKSIVWTTGSFSQLWWRLATINISEDRFDNALVCIASGLELEPDHPVLWIERGYIFNRIGRHREALDAYRTAATVRPWAPRKITARALRGQGSALIELARFSEAKDVYEASLELDPESELARKELEYIDHALADQERQAATLPWFLHAIKFPPTDPLTLQLIPFVQGMESIPGPKTVGAENYSAISKAFLTSGWAGFEEAFNAAIPRSRVDYGEIKRDLLRESIFNPKVHERLSKLFLGQATVEEVMEEIKRDNEPAAGEERKT